MSTPQNSSENTPTNTTNRKAALVATAGSAVFGASVAAASYFGARFGAAAALATTVVKVAVPEGFELVKSVIK